ncbi:dihydrodipicolinate synthase family protein [Herbiconiux moechotypicola]|uniref:4-hydroxy-tetrahydrodipicolinate synthase n=1 Tax=Herbiconiux moechotypicola TaxID=637393 RepID=A0ABP5QLC6_9MICO|nr:dihydrodipicolinate synthase family protein [Herbiconiux moechotypicola]MCS5731426.1 dihydrodipicolinate synthase family protein [Herbiconiux moechotypicola]
MTDAALITATPTAFDRTGAIDLASTVRIFEHAIGAGVDAIFVNGTTAEFAALSVDERRTTLAEAVRVAGPQRVIAHVGAASPYETRLLTDDALELGVERLSVLTPFYMPSSIDGVREQIQAATSIAGDAEIFLYLFPDRTGIQVSPTDAAGLIDEYDLAGAKISIAGTDYLAGLVAALTSPRTVLSGNDGLLREVLAAGGDGIVSGVSSSFPAPFVALVEAVRAGDAARVDELAEVVNRIVPVIGPSIAGLKLSLQRQGVIDEAHCRMAIDAPDAALTERIDAVLAREATPTFH